MGEIFASIFTRKRDGEQAEAAFLHKAIGFGLSVATPRGDSERYDLIVDSGRRLWRVQVKSTRYVGRAAVLDHGAGLYGGLYGR